MNNSRSFLVAGFFSQALNIFLVSMATFLVVIPNVGIWQSDLSALLVPACFWLGAVVLVALLDVGIGRILAPKSKSPALASTSLMNGLAVTHIDSDSAPL